MAVTRVPTSQATNRPMASASEVPVFLQLRTIQIDSNRIIAERANVHQVGEMPLAAAPRVSVNTTKTKPPATRAYNT